MGQPEGARRLTSRIPFDEIDVTLPQGD